MSDIPDTAIGRAIHHAIRSAAFRLAAQDFPDAEDTFLAAAQINREHSRRAIAQVRGGPPSDEPEAIGGRP